MTPAQKTRIIAQVSLIVTCSIYRLGISIASPNSTAELAEPTKALRDAWRALDDYLSQFVINENPKINGTNETQVEEEI